MAAICGMGVVTLPLADLRAASAFFGSADTNAASWRARLYGPAAVASLVAHAALLALLLTSVRERDDAMMPAGGLSTIQVEIAADSPTESVASSAAPVEEAPPAESQATDHAMDVAPPVPAMTDASSETAPAPTPNDAIATVPAPAETPAVDPEALAIQRAAQRQARLDEERRNRRTEQKRQERAAQLEALRQEKVQQEKVQQEKLRQDRERTRREHAEKARTDAERANRRAGVGQETTNSVAATRGGTVGVAAGAAQLANWRGQVLAHLAGYKQYPSAARERNVVGRPVVTFSLSPAGTVVSLSLVSSSGAAMLDDAALSMVRRAAPFPPMPAGGGRASFTTAINYNMR